MFRHDKLSVEKTTESLFAEIKNIAKISQFKPGKSLFCVITANFFLIFFKYLKYLYRSLFFCRNFVY